ncbi:MAG: alanyl-tRNA synthetase [Patescibacteria group bacterium]
MGVYIFNVKNDFHNSFKGVLVLEGMKITRIELIDKYIEFFKSKGHVEIAPASLVPENDPTVLFTTAGMQPLVPFLLGEDHPAGKRLVNIQRCIRTGDIDEVGDSTHHTMFEMMGNWSLGDYFKEDAIRMTFEFLIEDLGIPIEKFAVSVFGGDSREPSIPTDTESILIWKSLGVDDKRIARLEGGVYESENNWWGPAGSVGPCGPDTEVFYWKGTGPAPESFNDDHDDWVEIGNNVLMQYVKDKEGKYNVANQKNVDFGGGVERLLAILNGFDDNYLSEIWRPIIKVIEDVSYEHYDEHKADMRIIADHLKAAVFMAGDGVVPSNSEQGYIMRRLIRRAVRVAKKLGIERDRDLTIPIIDVVIDIYKDRYEYLAEKRDLIVGILHDEEEQFEKTLEKGLREFEKIVSSGNTILGEEAFLLFQSFGFPIELTVELADERGVSVDVEGFDAALGKHQDLSRTASAGMFASGLADHSDETTKLHTATHLLNEALRVVLNDSSIFQKGSNITPERLRFDFNFDRKLTPEERAAVEDKVNEIIKADLPVSFEVMSMDEAQKLGAQGVFSDKYGSEVKVYTMGESEDPFSVELCTGPHVARTGDLGRFVIKKEESSSAGVRRIKAILI